MEWVGAVRRVVVVPRIHLKLAALRRPVTMGGPESVGRGRWPPESDADARRACEKKRTNLL